MTEEQVVGGAEATPPGSPAEPPTPEQVEAEWKHRVSQKDKAHAAETKSLRDQLTALSGAASTAEQQATGSLSEAEALRRQLADSQKLLAQTQAEATAQIRGVKYPNAADALDASVLASMDEAKLAGLEARLSGPGQRQFPIDPSTPPRPTPASAKPTEKKTSAELRDDLQRMAPQIIAEMGRQD